MCLLSPKNSIFLKIHSMPFAFHHLVHSWFLLARLTGPCDFFFCLSLFFPCPSNVNFLLGFLISPLSWTTTTTSIQMTLQSHLPPWPFSRSKYPTAWSYTQQICKHFRLHIQDRTCPSAEAYSLVICHSLLPGYTLCPLPLTQGHFWWDTKFCL